MEIAKFIVAYGLWLVKITVRSPDCPVKPSDMDDRIMDGATKVLHDAYCPTEVLPNEEHY